MSLKIIKIPADILKRKIKEVSPTELASPDFQSLIEQMRTTMVSAKGIGLAANQIDRDVQVFVIDQKLAKEHGVPDVFINPEITEYSPDEDELEEGCLSIPNYYVQMRRSKKIKIKALDAGGKKIKFKARGFLARVLQHETDHLNGTVIKDRVSG